MDHKWYYKAYMRVLRDGLSICLFAHNEGSFLKEAYDSILQNLAKLSKCGIKLEHEIILIIDSPDVETAKIVNEIEKTGIKLEKVSTQDLGVNRNIAANLAIFDKIAFLDGDDIWDENWLALCLSKFGKSYQILHPETVVYCGERNEIAICKSSNRITSTKRIMRENLWVSSIFTRTKILLENRYYTKTELDASDFEDWNWNRSTLKKGLRHKVVKKSYIYVHTRKDSLSQNLIREMKSI
jgi:glycosyltransferase involved in cell wall biosynthesis